MIQYNWLKERGAISYDPLNRRMNIAAEKAVDTMEEIGDECLRIQLEGDYESARAFVTRWAFVAPELEEMTKNLADLPYEVCPIYRLEPSAGFFNSFVSSREAVLADK